MGIPKPLVQLNQIFILLFILLAFLIHTGFLFIPLIVGIITLIKKQNPLIHFSKNFLRNTASSYIQEDPEQQLFNQWIATICLALSILFYTLNFHVIGHVFSLLVAVAAGLALAGFCIGCTIRYRYKMWRYKQQNS
ncbi:DUF4395 family protein [Halalkalibacter urbisdiaboli]|uniref:DUF4395 family protein n=1 Tax=Halalkalibacter urbisdiaboli TaxID=1960589 RepID=UPI000B44F735|nr:DUF4395 family protein [Halalkalibacter urbisdiaboli]